jgi:hypothetical protein
VRKFSHLRRLPACTVLVFCCSASPSLVSAHSSVQPAAMSSWSVWDLPVLSWFAPAAIEPLSWETPLAPPPCMIEPLSEISDVEALEFEAAVGTEGVVNVAGLTPPTARALQRFEQVIVSAGGQVVLRSAYRPATYQSHLQEVWDKWMLQLRDNYNEPCAELRAAVEAEFYRHGLLETQRPATVSDHTRGISFDAVVTLSRGARLGRRKVTVDGLARMAGLYRPVAVNDPVHFRLL